MTGIPILFIWIYVTRHMELALDYCDTGVFLSGGVNSWDIAVSYYTGSLFDTQPGGKNEGVLLYALANEQCKYFGTCTKNHFSNEHEDFAAPRDGGLSMSQTITEIEDDTSSYDARINLSILNHFNQGQTNLMSGDCDLARRHKESIEQFMVVPLVQGYLRNLYSLVLPEMKRSTSMESDVAIDLSGADDGNGEHSLLRSQELVGPPPVDETTTIPMNDTTEGTTIEMLHARTAIFATSFLPLLHYCSEDDAMIVYEATAAIVEGWEPTMSYNFSTNNSSNNISHATFNRTSDINDDPTLSNSELALFWDVKSALERNYECFGILCKDVGELTYDTTLAGDMLLEGGSKSPCYLLSLQSSQAPSPAPASDLSIPSSAPTRNWTIGVLVLLLGVTVHSIL